MLTPEVKYAKDKVYPGNAPFKRHNQQKYLAVMEKAPIGTKITQAMMPEIIAGQIPKEIADALQKEEAEKVEPIAEIKL